MSVVAALEAELEELGARDERLARSALAASALVLAAELDRPGNSATSRSMCARALTEALLRLRELAPPEVAGDRVDDLVARRDRRRGAA